MTEEKKIPEDLVMMFEGLYEIRSKLRWLVESTGVDKDIAIQEIYEMMDNTLKFKEKNV